MKIKINKKLNEMSSMGGGAVQGHVDNRKKELNEELPEKVHKKARYLQDKEGKSRDQAYAIAINMNKDGKLDELYSTSGAVMGSGGGYGPFERSPEGHERYVRMRHDMQGLENFKQSRYFAEDKEEKLKIKIKIRKNLGERCQKGYKTHPKRKTKKMFGKTYRNCVKAEAKDPEASKKEDSKHEKNK